MQTRLRIPSKSGFDLSAILHSPDLRSVSAYAVFAHCFTCTKSLNASIRIAERLAQAGIATLRFDFTGLGASKGQFSRTSFSTNVADLESTAEYLAEHYEAPQLLVGHSLGGAAVLAASKLIGSIKAVATIGSPSAPDHVLHLLEGHLDELSENNEVEVELQGFTHKFCQSFVDDVKSYDLDISKLGKALMVMHAPLDNTVSITEATKIFTSARHPKTFASLDKSDHLLSKAEDADYAASLIASWGLRHIDIIPADPNAEYPKGIIAAGETAKMFYTIVNARSHKFIVDEPLSYKGTDLGPTPYEYLGAGLGACTSMTLNGYARRKDLNLKKVTVHVTHDRVHAEDCSACEKTEGKVDQFTRVINMEGNISDEQRARLLQIADLCPVHKTLENEIQIVTKLAE